MDRNLMTQELGMSDIKQEFLDLFEPVSGLFSGEFTEALLAMRKLINKLLKTDVQTEREKYKKLVDALVKNLEWLGDRDIDNSLGNLEDTFLFNDDYEITVTSGVMVIHKSKYFIEYQGKRVPYLAPECFNKLPDVEYVP